MARVTARQAFTRAKTRRQNTRTTMQQAMIESRARFVRQLNSIGIGAPSNDSRPQASTSRRREVETAAGKKITEYFQTTTNLDFMLQPQKRSPRTSVSIGANGVELITIYDSDAENEDVNNNSGDEDANRRKNSMSDNNESTNSDKSTSPLHGVDTKPSNLDLSRIDLAPMDLRVSVRLDEDIEIVDMLPPIPLRDHPVFDIEEN